VCNYLLFGALGRALVSMSLLLLLALLFVEPVRDRVFSIFAGRGIAVITSASIWAAVVEMIRDRPILGIGPGTVKFTLLYQRPRFNALSAYSIY